jgi:hypothetical protein
LRPTKGAEQTHQQQSGADAEQQKIRPRKIARHRKLREKFVTKQAADSDNEPNPERPIPFPFHRLTNTESAFDCKIDIGAATLLYDVTWPTGPCHEETRLRFIELF